MKAVIMAGGRGTRLRPLTCRLPKPMVPLLGRPVLEYSIQLLREEGFSNLAITSFYQPHILEAFFSNGEGWGVSIEHFREEEPLGTAGSVKNAEEFLDETFLVLSGDALTSISLKEAFHFHRERGSLATLILKRVENPLEYGVVMTDGDGRITRFLEKPSWGQIFSDTVNTGIYILEPEVLESMERGERVDFSRDLFPQLLEEGRPLYGYVAEGHWSDIGSLEEYRKAHYDLLTGRAGRELPIPPLKGGDIFIEEGAEVHQDAHLEGPLYIGRETIIEEGASLSSSVIGVGCHIGPKTLISGSILWDRVRVEPYGEIQGSLVGDNAQLGRQVLLEEGAALGSRVRVGDFSQIRQGVKVWPDRAIEEGSTLTRHLVKSVNYQRTLFGEHGACGRANLEITPEISCLLGSSFASLMPPESTQLITTDHHLISKINGQALQTGALSTGNSVVEAQELTIPVLRYAIRKLNVEGGAHIHLSSKEPQELIIEFFDCEGLNVTPSKERELERIYHQGSLRRAPHEKLGAHSLREGLEEEYVEGLLEGADRGGGLRILACHDDNASASLLERLLKGMNCQLLSFGQSPRDLILSDLQREVSEVHADLGLILDHNGEDLTLITEEGLLVDEDRYLVLLAILLMEKGFHPLVFPVTAPKVILDLAIDVEVALAGAHHHQVMRKFFAIHGKEALYCPFNDGLVALSWLLNLLLREEITLEELCYSIPPFYRARENVECPWEAKGRLLRNLVEEREEEPSLLEGVSFSHQEGSALILPHSEKPLFEIYAEAATQDEAERLAHEYREMITGLL